MLEPKTIVNKLAENADNLFNVEAALISGLGRQLILVPLPLPSRLPLDMP